MRRDLSTVVKVVLLLHKSNQVEARDKSVKLDYAETKPVTQNDAYITVKQLQTTV